MLKYELMVHIDRIGAEVDALKKRKYTLKQRFNRFLSGKTRPKKEEVIKEVEQELRILRKLIRDNIKEN